MVHIYIDVYAGLVQKADQLNNTQ